MTRRLGAFVALAVMLAILFMRLGVWQLERLRDRRARNAEMASRLALPPIAIQELAANDAYRRVTVSGVPDTSNEILLIGRSRSGSPGVHILTPLRLTGSDSGVLVVRGWVYSPDAASIDPSRWRELRREYTGYALRLPATSRPEARLSERKIRSLSYQTVAGLLPYPVLFYYLVAQDSARSTAPARLPPPALDEGPHLGYAVQWFAFAAIALIGAAVVVVRSRRALPHGATGATGA